MQQTKQSSISSFMQIGDAFSFFSSIGNNQSQSQSEDNMRENCKVFLIFGSVASGKTVVQSYLCQDQLIYGVQQSKKLPYILPKKLFNKATSQKIPNIITCHGPIIRVKQNQNTLYVQIPDHKQLQNQGKLSLYLFLQRVLKQSKSVHFLLVVEEDVLSGVQEMIESFQTISVWLDIKNQKIQHFLCESLSIIVNKVAEEKDQSDIQESLQQVNQQCIQEQSPQLHRIIQQVLNQNRIYLIKNMQPQPQEQQQLAQKILSEAKFFSFQNQKLLKNNLLNILNENQKDMESQLPVQLQKNIWKNGVETLFMLISYFSDDNFPSFQQKSQNDNEKSSLNSQALYKKIADQFLHMKSILKNDYQSLNSQKIQDFSKHIVPKKIGTFSSSLASKIKKLIVTFRQIELSIVEQAQIQSISKSQNSQNYPKLVQIMEILEDIIGFDSGNMGQFLQFYSSQSKQQLSGVQFSYKCLDQNFEEIFSNQNGNMFFIFMGKFFFNACRHLLSVLNLLNNLLNTQSSQSQQQAQQQLKKIQNSQSRKFNRQYLLELSKKLVEIFDKQFNAYDLNLLKVKQQKNRKKKKPKTKKIKKDNIITIQQLKKQFLNELQSKKNINLLDEIISLPISHFKLYLLIEEYNQYSENEQKINKEYFRFCIIIKQIAQLLHFYQFYIEQICFLLEIKDHIRISTVLNTFEKILNRNVSRKLTEKEVEFLQKLSFYAKNKRLLKLGQQVYSLKSHQIVEHTLLNQSISESNQNSCQTCLDLNWNKLYLNELYSENSQNLKPFQLLVQKAKKYDQGNQQRILKANQQIIIMKNRF